MFTRGWGRPLLAAVLVLPLLQACGGGSNSKDASLRLVNLSSNSSLELYEGDSLLSSAVLADSAGSSVSLDADSHTLRLKNTGSSSTLLTTTPTLAEETDYTLLAYTSGEALKTVVLTEDEDTPDSGVAEVRVFNGSTEAGALDIYVTATDASLSGSSASVSSLAAGSASSYVEFGSGSYRIRVTGAGDKTDLRLDIPSVTLSSQQVNTLVLTSTPGGVLVHGAMLTQGGGLTLHKTTQARLRLVASAASNGVVSATANTSASASASTSTNLASSVRSPSVGGYVLVEAGSLAVSATVDGVSTSLASGQTLAAGADATLLLTGTASNPQLTLIEDDNRPALLSANTKLRLVHGVTGLASTLSLTADYGAVASNVALNGASTPVALTASTTLRLEATSATSSNALYLASDVTLLAGHVYTVFMLGESSNPQAVLRRDR